MAYKELEDRQAELFQRDREIEDTDELLNFADRLLDSKNPLRPERIPDSPSRGSTPRGSNSDRVRRAYLASRERKSAEQSELGVLDAGTPSQGGAQRKQGAAWHNGMLSSEGAPGPSGGGLRGPGLQGRRPDSGARAPEVALPPPAVGQRSRGFGAPQAAPPVSPGPPSERPFEEPREGGAAASPSVAPSPGPSEAPSPGLSEAMAGGGSDTAARIQRTRLEALNEQLAHFKALAGDLDARLRESEAERRREGDDRKRGARQHAQAQAQAEKEASARETAEAEAARLRGEVSSLRRDLEALRRSGSRADSETKSRDVRLQRALDDVKKHKDLLAVERSSKAEDGEALRMQVAKLEAKTGRLEKQKVGTKGTRTPPELTFGIGAL